MNSLPRTIQTGRARERGFTLIELLVVIAIIVLLAGTIIGLLINGKKRAENERCKAAMTILTSAIDLYKETHGNPPKIEDALDEPKRNNLLLRELLLTKEYKQRGGLTRRTPPALSDIQTIIEFLGDSDGDWDPSQPFLADGGPEEKDILVEGVEILDPWGQPFIYKFPGRDHSVDIPGASDNSATFDLYSVGRNGIDDYDAGPNDENDDWTNWLPKDQADQ